MRTGLQLRRNDVHTHNAHGMAHVGHINCIRHGNQQTKVDVGAMTERNGELWLRVPNGGNQAAVIICHMQRDVIRQHSTEIRATRGACKALDLTCD